MQCVKVQDTQLSDLGMMKEFAKGSDNQLLGLCSQQ
jgi:hypothetical protein